MYCNHSIYWMIHRGLNDVFSKLLDNIVHYIEHIIGSWEIMSVITIKIS